MTAPTTPILLLADPDQDQAVTLMQLLRLEGYVVHTAASAEQAQQVARAYPLDVALIHERLPGRSGFALCRALHLGRPDLPILMMLRESEEAIGNAFEAGATDYLTAPVSPMVLSRRVAQALKAARMQTRAAALERRWTQSFEQHHAPKLLIDPSSGSVVDANPAACALYGYTRDQLQKLHLRDLEAVDRPGDDGSSALSTLFSARHRAANGDTRPVKVLSGPVEIDGRTLVLAIIVDQSKRTRIEAAARAQRELHAQLNRSAVVLMHALDLPSVLQQILIDVGEYVRSDAALLLLTDSDVAYTAAARGYEGHTTAAALQEFRPVLRTTAPLAWMIEQRRPLLIADTARYTGWLAQAAMRWVGSQLSAPLVFEDVVLGFVLLLNAAPGFTDRDPERLMAFAGTASLALHAALAVEAAQGDGVS